jgi:aspartyl-tRNA(Asn)/glutamyl-tRNA(Gln) amidotransferase subunit C
MIDKKVIEHIALLARLEVSDKQAQEYSEQLSKVLKFFEQIEKVDTTGVEPLITPTEIEAFWREDIVVKDLSAEEITANAPDKIGNLFRVPPVV